MQKIVLFGVMLVTMLVSASNYARIVKVMIVDGALSVQLEDHWTAHATCIYLRVLIGQELHVSPEFVTI